MIRSSEKAQKRAVRAHHFVRANNRLRALKKYFERRFRRRGVAGGNRERAGRGHLCIQNSWSTHYILFYGKTVVASAQATKT